MKYSNCLIEAIKAKIRNPKVKIIFLNKKENNGNRHFLWKVDGKVFHYERLNDCGKSFLFNGTIKTQSEDTFEAFILKRLAFKKMDVLKYAKKFNLNSVNEPGFLDWVTYCPDFDEYNLPKENKIAKLVLIINNDKIEVKKISECNLGDESYIKWKYVSPYSSEWDCFSTDAR